ncbi:MAG TPA: hypothetical protein VGF54_05095 [Streptosporangiaceae bacterium]
MTADDVGDRPLHRPVAPAAGEEESGQGLAIAVRGLRAMLAGPSP